MRQTLFTIDHFWFDGPLLYAWLVVGLLILAWFFWQDQSRKQSQPEAKAGEAMGFLPVYLIVAAGIYFVLPRLEIADLDGNPAGLAVRGYGLFMLLAIVSGLGVAWWRCRQTRFPFETVLSVAFWMILCGICGARIFYLVQKHRENPIESVGDLLWQLVDMTGGGLVVYGAIFGGTLAFFVVCWFRQLPALRVADIIAPAMAIGQSLGRLGCLMNGCCFGGPCELDAIAIQFPAGSPPYMRQLENGRLWGLETRPLYQYPLVRFQEMDTNRDSQVERGEYEQWQNGPLAAKFPTAIKYSYDDLLLSEYSVVTQKSLESMRVVESVAADSLAAEAGLQEGRLISVYPGSSELLRAVKRNETDPDGQPRQGNAVVLFGGGGGYNMDYAELPDWGIRIHPTQIYSAINAALIFLFLWFYFPFRRGHGEVFAWMLVLYAITRFCLESIRIDELPFLGPFSISQTISFPVLAAGLLMVWISRSRFPVDRGTAAEPR